MDPPRDLYKLNQAYSVTTVAITYLVNSGLIALVCIYLFQYLIIAKSVKRISSLLQDGSDRTRCLRSLMFYSCIVVMALMVLAGVLRMLSIYWAIPALVLTQGSPKNEFNPYCQGYFLQGISKDNYIGYPNPIWMLVSTVMRISDWMVFTIFLVTFAVDTYLFRERMEKK